VRPRPFTLNGATVLPLNRRAGGIQAFKMILPVRPGPDQPPEQRTHEGHDWIYVLSGLVRLVLGPHDLTLVAGEAAEFDTRTPHGFWNAGTEPAELLGLFGPQGERMHVRARPATAP